MQLCNDPDPDQCDSLLVIIAFGYVPALSCHLIMLLEPGFNRVFVLQYLPLWTCSCVSKVEWHASIVVDNMPYNMGFAWNGCVRVHADKEWVVSDWVSAEFLAVCQSARVHQASKQSMERFVLCMEQHWPEYSTFAAASVQGVPLHPVQVLFVTLLFEYHAQMLDGY